MMAINSEGRDKTLGGGGLFYWSFVDPEMEFLNINLTKDLSLLLHAIHSPFYWRIFKETILFSG
jgi:hypothetical protein